MMLDIGIGGTLDAELIRTAEMLVYIADQQGIFFAVALLVDSSYDLERMQKLLPFLKKTHNAIKKPD